MKKIPTLFERNAEDRRHVTSTITPGCEWVIEGQGVATRKYDGTCVMLDGDGQWWARREVKANKATPANYRAEQHDDVTGKTVGWEPMEQSSFAKFHAEALGDPAEPRAVGTYELCGPKVNGNPEQALGHVLISHADAETINLDVPATYDAISAVVRDLRSSGWEGIVWHHPDGRMAKLKARDIV